VWGVEWVGLVRGGEGGRGGEWFLGGGGWFLVGIGECGCMYFGWGGVCM